MIEREGFSFAIEVTYERLPAFCSHCKNIGHHISNCRWLHPTKDNHVIDKQKKAIVSQKQQTQKLQPKDNPNGIGSSKAFEAPVIQHAASDGQVPQVDLTHDQTQDDTTTRQEENHSNDESIPNINVDARIVQQANKEFSVLNIEFQTVEEDIPKTRLQRTSFHVLEEATAVAQIEVHSQEVEQTQTQEDVQDIFIAAEEHDVLQGNNEAEITVTNREQFAPSRPLDNTGSIASDEINVATLNESGRVIHAHQREVHISKYFQSDMDLWARIRENDK